MFACIESYTWVQPQPGVGGLEEGLDLQMEYKNRMVLAIWGKIVLHLQHVGASKTQQIDCGG